MAFNFHSPIRVAGDFDFSRAFGCFALVPFRGVKLCIIDHSHQFWLQGVLTVAGKLVSDQLSPTFAGSATAADLVALGPISGGWAGLP